MVAYVLVGITVLLVASFMLSGLIFCPIKPTKKQLIKMQGDDKFVDKMPIYHQVEIVKKGEKIKEFQNFKGRPLIPAILKTVSSLGFVGIAIAGFFYGSATSYQFVILLLGLCFGLLGDVFLALKSVFKNKYDKLILCGIVSFAIGHILYLLYFQSLITIPIVVLWIAFLLTAMVLAGFKFMKMKFRKLIIPVTIYSLLIFLMATVSVYTVISFKANIASVLLLIGAIMFVISDGVLSMIYFSPIKSNFLGFVNLSTYYVAQILIALSIMFI